MGQLDQFNSSTLTAGASARSESKEFDELLEPACIISTPNLYAPHTSGTEIMHETRANSSGGGKVLLNNPIQM